MIPGDPGGGTPKRRPRKTRAFNPRGLGSNPRLGGHSRSEIGPRRRLVVGRDTLGPEDVNPNMDPLDEILGALGLLVGNQLGPGLPFVPGKGDPTRGGEFDPMPPEDYDELEDYVPGLHGPGQIDVNPNYDYDPLMALLGARVFAGGPRSFGEFPLEGEWGEYAPGQDPTRGGKRRGWPPGLDPRKATDPHPPVEPPTGAGLNFDFDDLLNLLGWAVY